MTTIQGNIDGEADRLVALFTDQPDNDAEQTCYILKELYSWAQQFLQNMNSFAWNYLTAGVNFSPVAKLSGIPNPASPINSFVDMPFKIGDGKMKFDAMDHQAAWNEAKDSSDAQELDMGRQYLEGICQAVGGGKDDKNYERSGFMKEHVEKVFILIRESIEDFRLNLFRGDKMLDENHTVLELLIGNPRIQEANTRFKEGRSAFER